MRHIAASAGKYRHPEPRTLARPATTSSVATADDRAVNHLRVTRRTRFRIPLDLGNLG